MPIKKFLRDYLSFSKTDRRGMVALVFLILLIYFLPIVFRASSIRVMPAALKLEAEDGLDTLQERSKQLGRAQWNSRNARNGSQNQIHRNEQDPSIPTEVFSFDPNLASEEDLRRLGLPARTAATILKFRSKGGKFFRADDLKKIWGLPPGFYQRVHDHIHITPREESRRLSFEHAAPDIIRPGKTILPVDVNTADSAAFESLPGIGARLSQRIVQFRDKLGGFYSTSQLSEVFGLADSVFQKISPYLQLTGTVKLISINTVTKDELKLHPYFRWKFANAIIEYRNQHGNFKSLEAVKNVSAIDEQTYSQMMPYLRL